MNGVVCIIGHEDESPGIDDSRKKSSKSSVDRIPSSIAKVAM
jgi:hypothetical protein